MESYQDFLEGKRALAPKSGFDPGREAIHDVLMPHQSDIVRWALIGGRRAIFASFGLGKSLMQLEIMRQVAAREGGRQLIVCPLGVRQEFRRDAGMIGLEPTFVRRTEEIGGDGIYLTNYESVRDGRLDVSGFNAASLDEASVLRSYGSKTYQTFLDAFKDVQYRFVATATPSPNRYKELIHYSAFLGLMDSGQALMRFFKRDSTKANNLTLYESQKDKFFAWLQSWAVFVQKPSDLGYSDDGYVLPDMEVVWHRVETPASDRFQQDRDGQSRLFVDASLGVQDASRAKRDTMAMRVQKAKEIVEESPDDHFILWHDLEAERHAIKKAMPEAVEVYGSQDLDQREQRIVDFSDGKFRLLATKPILSGSGCNFQRHCHREVFVGIGFKFNDFIQSIHRVQRFQQTERVRIDIIYADTEDSVVQTLKRKWEQHEELVTKMEGLIKEYGLADSAIAEALRMNMDIERIEASGEGWLVANNDTVEEAKLLEDDSIDLMVTSIPFSNHYSYCPNYRDMGATDDDAHFFRQMDFLTPNLYRALRPGRILAVHTKDRIQFGNVTGAGLPTVEPFHMEAYGHYHKHGFDYLGMITVVTDVVRENNQTYRLGWTEMCKDGTKMGVGCPEYILLFHKPQTDRTRGYADVPVVHDKDQYSRARWQVDAHAFWRSSGNRPLTSEEIAALPVGELTKAFTQRTMESVYDYQTHVRIGDELEGHGHLPATFMAIAPGSWSSDVWADVVRMRTLNTSQAQRGREAHVCPLPMDIVDRLIERYSNPGELVYDPFGGLFTVPYEALRLGRRGRAVELNTQYFLDGVSYLKAMERELSMPTLFDIEGIATGDA